MKFLLQRLIREAALRHNCFATFMAKPIEDEPGSAMHIHHSILDKNTGKIYFLDRKVERLICFTISLAVYREYLPCAIAVLAPYVNSYRRYVKDHAAPINLEWARDNRTTGIRVPLSSNSARRVENRLAGMDCNPYLGIAISLACGYLGIKNEIRPSKQFRGDAYEEAEDIPRGLGSALDLFEEATPLHKILGTEFCRVYSIVKRQSTKNFYKL